MKKKKQRPQPAEFTLPASGADIISLITGNEITFSPITLDYWEPYGIQKGDILVVHRAETFAEDKPSVWLAANEEHTLVGYAFDNFGDISVHQPCGKIIRYKKREARKFIGNVVYVIRRFEGASPFEPAAPSVESAAEGELTAVCSECKKTETGSRSFLKAQGWKLRGEQLCLACDLD